MKFTQTQITRYKRIRTLKQMRQMDPVDFEMFTGWLYKLDGYRVRETAVTGDQGVDLLLYKGRKKIVVQCKRYSGNVGQPVVRDLFGAMHHEQAHEAHLVTTGTISRHAEDWATGKPINLTDGHDLVAWMNRVRRDDLAGSGAWRKWAVRLGVMALLIALVSVAAVGWTMRERLAPATEPPIVVPPTAVSTHTPAPTETPADQDPIVANPTPTLAPRTTPALAATAVERLDIPYTDTPLQIDGDLSDWPLTGGIAIPYVTEQDGWDGERDITAVWRLAWDENTLYLAINVVDDTHIQEREAKFAYYGDSAELQIDTRFAVDANDTNVNTDDLQFIFSPGNFGDIPAGAFRFRGTADGVMQDNPGTEAIVAATRTSDGYWLEAGVRWSELGLDPSSGLRLRMALSNNDIDTPNLQRQTLMLSHVETRQWLDPTSWGEARLVR